MRRLLGIGAMVIFLILPVGVLAERSDGNTSKTTTFQGQTWTCDEAVRAAEVVYRGRPALHVSVPSSGTLSVAGVDFRNGAIEVDLAAPRRGIPGIGFRGLSEGEWRNRVFFQRLHRGEREKQEALDQAVVTCRKGTNIVLITHFSKGPREGRLNWFHVRLVVQGDSVAIFLEGEEKPIVTLGAVLEDGKGTIGLCGSDFYLSNFKFAEES
ncbi:MAG: hypothetical protein H8E44_18250 [Planctomycetes bacterium]|nr:hypothetical protein [Planctomycetota bacterium]